MEIFKNIKEILELCNEELIKNNKETYATLDYEDLLELKEMYNKLEKFYAGELYTSKQLKNAENIGDIIKENKELKEKIDIMRRKIYRLEEDNMELLKKDGNTDKTNYKYVECPKVEAEWYKSENYIEENYIPKSKIKEKIEELEKQAEEVKNHYKGTYACLDEYLNAKSKIQGFKELLEGE